MYAGCVYRHDPRSETYAASGFEQVPISGYVVSGGETAVVGGGIGGGAGAGGKAGGWGMPGDSTPVAEMNCVAS